MNISKTQSAKAGPACGRAVTGLLLIETSMAGRPSNSGFETARPVSGLTPAGKESASGPRAGRFRRGWAAGVKVGTRLGAGSRVSVGALVAVGTGVLVAVGMTSALACGAQEASRKVNTNIKTRVGFMSGSMLGITNEHMVLRCIWGYRKSGVKNSASSKNQKNKRLA
jgi:hypothetical protein